MKSPSSVIGPATRSSSRRTCTQPDYEGELAVVIGRRARDVAAWTTRSTSSRASRSRTTSRRAITSSRPDSGAGRSRSTRSARSDRRWSRSTRSTSRRGLPIETRVSGEVLQSSNTSELVFSVPELIAWISQGCTLEPGDVILTGTPAGVGAARTPPAGWSTATSSRSRSVASARCEPGRPAGEAAARAARCGET